MDGGADGTTHGAEGLPPWPDHHVWIRVPGLVHRSIPAWGHGNPTS